MNFYIFVTIYVKKLESQASATYTTLVGWFVYITPNVGELETQTYALIVFITYPHLINFKLSMFRAIREVALT